MLVRFGHGTEFGNRACKIYDDSEIVDEEIEDRGYVDVRQGD